MDATKTEYTTPPTKPQMAWWLRGLSWALTMYVCMEIIFPLFSNEKLKIKNLLIAIPIWAISGLVFGFLLSVIERKLIKKKQG